MPFDSKTGQIAGQTGGKRSAAKRWAGKTMKRDKSIPLVVTQEELDMMNVKASAEGISRTEMIVRAVRNWTEIGITKRQR
jgi:predicted DNA binding CopG/RHH family protein